MLNLGHPERSAESYLFGARAKPWVDFLRKVVGGLLAEGGAGERRLVAFEPPSRWAVQSLLKCNGLV